MLLFGLDLVLYAMFTFKSQKAAGGARAAVCTRLSAVQYAMVTLKYLKGSEVRVPLFTQDFVLYAMFTLKYQKGSGVRVPLFEQGLVLFAMFTFEVPKGAGGACSTVCTRLSAVFTS